MKHLKRGMMLLLTAAIFTSCEKETVVIPENGSARDQSIAKENLNGRPYIDIPAGDLYALHAWNSSENIALYNYNPSDDNISLNEGFIGSTGKNQNFGFDFNTNDGLIYLLANDATPRYLYTYNKDTEEVTYIDQIGSVEGNNFPEDLTFGNDGTLYFAFMGGEINSYNVTTKAMSAFSEVSLGSGQGDIGLTYDFDNNQLIYATGNDPVRLYSIDILTGNVESLFNYGYNGKGNAIEYVGNNKLIASGVDDNGTIYSVDLGTEDVDILLDETAAFYDIKDLMFIINTDSDGDGFLNEEDSHPNSDLREYLNIADNSTTIKNKMVKNGSTMMDQLNDLIAQTNEQYNGQNYPYHHKRFMTKLAQLTYNWRTARLITATQRSQISSIAWEATIPYHNYD